MSSLSEMMYATLESHGCKLGLMTNSEKFYHFFKSDPFVRHHIPNLHFIIEGSDQLQSYYQIHFYETTGEPSVYLDENLSKLHVTGLLGQHFDVLTFVFVALQFFTRMYQEKGFFTLHCGAVTFGEKAILLIGGEAAGKSTITTHLCAQYRASYLCDERVLLSFNNHGVVSCAGGNTVLTLRPDAIDYMDMPTLANTFYELKDLSIAKHKISLLPRFNNLRSVPVEHIVFLRLSNRTPQIRTAFRETAIYDLYSYLSEEIHGTRLAFLNVGFAMPSLDTQALRHQRLFVAQAMGSSEIHMWKCEGSIEAICRMITDLVVSGE